MKLLLTSAGITNESLKQAVFDLAGKTDLKIAFIPTAANPEVGEKGWLIDNLVECRELGAVDVVEIAALSKSLWLPRLQSVDVIFVGGGNYKYLMEQMTASGFDAELASLLTTKVYVGISAGSMVLSKSLWCSYEYLYGEEDGAPIAGLGVVDFNIRPHLNSPHFPKVREDTVCQISKENPAEIIYALDDQSAVQCVDGKVSIISEGVTKRFPE
jgi:dipeptidase E